MKKKIIFIIKNFGYLILSIMCFVIGEITISLKHIDSSFLKQFTSDELAVIVYTLLGVIFLIMGLVDMTILLIKKGDDKS